MNPRLIFVGKKNLFLKECFFFFLKKIIWKKQLVSDTEDLNYRNLSDYSSDCFFKCFLLGNILKYFFKKKLFLSSVYQINLKT